MNIKDGGLADNYWQQYYTPEEVQEIIDSTTTTMIISGHYPIHVRLYAHPHRAPTIVMAHGMLVYGLILARLQLPFFRAGFNVVQFDIPGLGQSGGPRAGCTTRDIFQAWDDAIGFAHKRFGDPLYAMGVAEDGITCYYVAANRPEIRALSMHTLFEYGDAGGVHWQGAPWLVKVKAVGMGAVAKVRPTFSIRGTQGIPFDGVFGGPEDGPLITLLENDPLGLQDVEFRFTYSLIQQQKAPVAFEDCRTPVQIIASEKNEIWPYEMVTKNFTRLGGPKELVTLPGAPQWEFNVPFHENYCAHVISWFKRNGARVAARFEEQGATPLPRAALQGRLNPAFRPNPPPGNTAP